MVSYSFDIDDCNLLLNRLSKEYRYVLFTLSLIELLVHVFNTIKVGKYRSDVPVILFILTLQIVQVSHKGPSCTCGKIIFETPRLAQCMSFSLG